MNINKEKINEKISNLGKSSLTFTSILYNIIGIVFFIISLFLINELRSDDIGYIMFKKYHWAAIDTTYHNGSLNISVIDKNTNTNVPIEEIYLSNSKIGENIQCDSCELSKKIPIKNLDFAMLNLKVCSDKQWIVDKWHYSNSENGKFILDHYKILVNNTMLDARNVGRFGSEYNFFLDLKRIKE